MPEANPVFELLRESLKDASKERKEQTEAFSDAMTKQTDAFSKSLHGLRTELRWLALAAIVVLGGLSGLNVYFKGGGVEVGAAQPSDEKPTAVATP